MTAYETNTQPAQYNSTTHPSKVFGGRWSSENDSFDGRYNSVAYSTTREHFSKEGFLYGHLQHGIPLRGRSFYWSSESDEYREDVPVFEIPPLHTVRVSTTVRTACLSHQSRRGLTSRELFPPSADIERHKHRADHLSASATYLPGPAHDLWIPTQLAFVDSPNTPSTPTASSSSSSQAESSITRNIKEPKKPSLASNVHDDLSNASISTNNSAQSPRNIQDEEGDSPISDGASSF
ncbi:hypothetical protein BDZ97DRAFT_1918633 [Flammula alnicola]|nr:hypothetical protein BDZ97DRAFT_1918633 [Flammula alnicola]